MADNHQLQTLEGGPKHRTMAHPNLVEQLSAAQGLQVENNVSNYVQKDKIHDHSLTLIFISAQPLNLANSPSLHLLTPEEQTLCSQLRILPKPYLVIKETLVREYARRGGKLRRREARDLVKIDVNKTSRVWDFLVQAGFMRVGLTDPNLTTGTANDAYVASSASSGFVKMLTLAFYVCAGAASQLLHPLVLLRAKTPHSVHHSLLSRPLPSPKSVLYPRSLSLPYHHRSRHIPALPPTLPVAPADLDQCAESLQIIIGHFDVSFISTLS